MDPEKNCYLLAYTQSLLNEVLTAIYAIPNKF